MPVPIRHALAGESMMLQKREQMWWLAACVIGLLVAAWAAGGFIGPLLAVFIVLFLAGAVLVEVDGRDRTDVTDAEYRAADTALDDVKPRAGVEPDAELHEAETDVREAATSLA